MCIVTASTLCGGGTQCIETETPLCRLTAECTACIYLLKLTTGIIVNKGRGTR